MRFIAPVAFIGTAGLRASWRPSSTLQTPLVLVESNPVESSLRLAPHANSTRSSIAPTDSSTLGTRRKWIQCTVLSSTTIITMSFAAKAALANDNLTDPNLSQTNGSAVFASPFRQWLHAKLTMKKEDRSSQGDSDESSNGNDDSSSSVGGSSISSSD